MARRTNEFEVCEPIVRGTVHELEHTDDWETAMDIATDHLIERMDYYDVLERAMGEVKSNPGAAAGAIATLLLPYAIDLAMKYPREAGRVLNYAAMVAFPPYGMLRAGMAASHWARGKVKRALGYEPNGVTESLSHLSPATRRVVENILKWMVGAFELAQQGVEKSNIIQWLRDNGIASRLASAIADAVIAVLAQEAAEGVRAGGHSLARRALGTASAPHPNPGGRYYVWEATPKSLKIRGEPTGPYELWNAKTYARIAATKGNNNRIVTRGANPEVGSFDVVRIYEAGTGKRLDVEQA